MLGEGRWPGPQPQRFAERGDKLLYVNAVLDHIVVDHLVRKTIVFCEQKRLEMAGIEAEQFQDLLVHEPRRHSTWPGQSC